MLGQRLSSRYGFLSLRGILLALTVVSLFVLVYLSLVKAPDPAFFSAPLTQRIFYYHVPAAWVAYLAFAVTFGGSLYVLWNEDKPEAAGQVRAADGWAAASAEVGTVFSLVALGTGLVWSRVEFINYDPFQDPKLISLLGLIVAYLAYFALRRGVGERERRQRLSAVFGIAAFISVPLTYYTSKVSVHPDFIREESSLSPEMRNILLFGLLAFTFLYASLLLYRRDLLAMEAAVEDETHRSDLS